MSCKIYQGFLYKKIPYNTFDEIISFITPEGRKIACLSTGSLKINSKNARNLFLGAYIEFEIFEARIIGKISKLKKAHTLNNFDWEKENNSGFRLLNWVIDNNKLSSPEFFQFYSFIIELILNDTCSPIDIKNLICFEYLKKFNVDVFNLFQPIYNKYIYLIINHIYDEIKEIDNKIKLRTFTKIKNILKSYLQ